MRFTIDQIEAFILVTHHGSFSAAARALSRSQSTVSTAIANLEIAVGVDLFDRSTRSPTLTDAGQALLPEAKSLYARSIAFERHGDHLAGGIPSTITVAISVPPLLVSDVMTRFASRFPHTDMRIRNPLDGDTEYMVSSGEASMGVALAVPDYEESMAFYQLGKIIMTHIAHRDHPLAKIPKPTFDDLREHRRLVYNAHASALPTSEYLQSTQVWTSDSYDDLVALVTRGVGWATLPRAVVRDLIQREILVELDLEAYPHTDWLVSVDLLWDRTLQPNVAEAWLLSEFKKLKITEISPDGQPTTR